MYDTGACSMSEVYDFAALAGPFVCLAVTRGRNDARAS